MADFVQLIVQVDKSQLTSLQAEVAKLNGSNINIKTDKSGIDAAANSVKGLGAAAKETSGLTNLLGGSLTTIVAKMTAWQVIGAGVATVIRSFKDAVNTLKEVDTQLVTVRKVTGFDDAEIAKIKKQAFEVASAYGETADAYLESVAAFARAGYLEQSTALAELSTKTQIVGDTTAETANQFLLSVDAAYQYKGSIEALSAVLDGANELDNKYATSIEKIAEGMGIVAPVAAQMHVGIDELAASIGTITAVTQRSGTEAARALRALFLNIVGDTKTEIDEGVTWTTGEIEGLRDVIKIYAKDAYEAAEATGSVIDPMEAIGGLAQSMKDGLLTEQQLMEMVSDIGGKLRTSQLLALIQNWDMYQSMLGDYANAVGSADKEVENALDSWERKTNILKNTWTEFISNFVNTEAVKTSLDVITGTIEALDTGAGRAVVTIGVLGGALTALAASHPVLAAVAAGVTVLGAAIGTAHNLSQKIKDDWDEMEPGLSELREATDATSVALKESGKAFNETSDDIIKTEITARRYLSTLEELSAYTDTSAEAQYRYNAVVNALNDLIPGLGLTIDETTGHIEQETDAILANIDAWKKKAVSEALQSRYEAIYEQEAELLIARAEAEAGLEAAQESRAVAQAEMRALEEQYVTDNDALLAMSKAEIEANDGIARSMSDVQAEIDRADIAIDDYAQALAEADEQIAECEGALGDLDEITERLTEDTDDLSESMQSNAISAMVEDLLTLEDELEGAKAAIEAFGKATSSEKGDTFSAYAGIYNKFLEDWEAGLHGSNTVKAAIEAIFGADVIAEYAGDWEALGELLASDFWRGVFADDGGDYGANFMNALADIADENGNIVDSNGNVVASFEEVGDTLSLTGYDLEGLAEMLGTTPDVIMSMLDAWDIWDSALLLSRDEILDLADSLNALNGTNTVDVSAFLQGLVDSAENYSAADIWDLYNALSQMDDIELTNVPEDIGAIISKAGEAQSATESAAGAVSDLDEESADPKITADTRSFDSSIASIKRTLEQLSSTPTVVTIIEQTKKASAGGTDSAEGGETLVNEEGPELIQEGDTARIAGGGLPTITDVEPGARIFTAEETRRILAGRSGYDVFRAAKDGSKGGTNVSGASGPRYTTTSTSGYSSSSSRSYSSASYSTTSAATAAASTLEEKQKEIEDRYKEQLDLLESQLALMEKQGASASERAEKITEIEDLLASERAELQQIGASETDINNLQVDWYERREDRQELLQQEIEDEIALRKSELDILEKQNAPADEQIAKLVQIQSLLHTQAEYMRSIGASQTEINKLSSEWLEIQKQIGDLQGTYDGAVERIISLRENELRLLEATNAGPYALIDKMREIQGALHEEAEYLRGTAEYQEALRQQQEDETKLTEEQVALLNRVHNLSISWMEYQEKIESERTDRQEKLLAVEEAQLALANAQNERTVRQYNAATGQWEWVANAQNVSQAQQALSDAQNALGSVYPFEVRKTASPNAMTLPGSFLSFSLNGGVMEAVMQQMGIVTSAGYSYNGLSGGTKNSYGSVQNGDIFQMNGITIGEAQARSMTVYDFAQMARTLALHKSAI